MNYLSFYFVVALVFASTNAESGWRQWEFSTILVNMQTDIDTPYNAAFNYFVQMRNFYEDMEGAEGIIDRIQHTLDGLSETHEYISEIFDAAINQMQMIGDEITTAENNVYNWLAVETVSSDLCATALADLWHAARPYAGRYILNCISTDVAHFQYLAVQYVNSIINTLEEFSYYANYPDEMQTLMDSEYEMDQCYTAMQEFVKLATTRSTICNLNALNFIGQTYDNFMAGFSSTVETPCTANDFPLAEQFPLQTEPEVIFRQVVA